MRVGTGHHVIFDEAHMSVPANRAPLAVESLQRLGYYSREAWIDDDIKSEMSSDIRNTIQVELRTDSATAPSRGIVDSIGLNLFLDTSSVDIAPQETVLLHTGISAKSPAGTYLRIAPRSGLTIKRHLTTLAGVVDPDYR